MTFKFVPGPPIPPGFPRDWILSDSDVIWPTINGRIISPTWGRVLVTDREMTMRLRKKSAWYRERGAVAVFARVRFETAEQFDRLLHRDAVY